MEISSYPIYAISTMKEHSKMLAVGSKEFLFCDLKNKNIVQQRAIFGTLVKTIQQYYRSDGKFTVLLQSGELHGVDLRNHEKSIIKKGTRFDKAFTIPYSYSIICNDCNASFTFFGPTMKTYGIQHPGLPPMKSENFIVADFHQSSNAFCFGHNKELISTYEVTNVVD